MTSAPKRFPLGLDDLVRVPASKTGKQGSKTGAQGSAGDKANIGVKTATKATVAHAGFDTMKKAASGAASQGVSRPVSAVPTRAEPSRISPEQRSRAAALATEHAKPTKPAKLTQPAQPVTHRTVPAEPAATTPPPVRILTRVPVPPRAERPVVAAVKPTVQARSSSSAAPANFSLTSERVRERMVERVRASGVSDPRVLAAMAAVPRHLFVDPGFATQAYEEAALPIGHHQTISKPSVVARMIEIAANGRVLDNVLEIGTGCGYQAAVLSGVARDVYSIERIRPLYERAKQNLRPLRIPNIRLHYGDGRLGMPKVAPFDAIVIAAAGLDVPQALLEQLQIGGRLIAPVGAQSQVLTLVERVAENQWHESQLDRVFFVPLKSGVI